MAYERVQKSGWHSPIQKKQSQIVPPLIDNQTQADSLPASGVTVSGIPSKAQRDAIRRSLFEKWAGTGQIQAKLTIGEPGDKYEQEADRVAAQVVNQINMPASQQSTQSQSVQREAIPEEEDELQMKSEAGTIQREEMPEEEEELQMKPTIQCQPSGDGMAATPELEASIQQARGSGQPLSDSIREPMEQAFGADFSGVKVHTDTQSDQLNQSVQAKAFTTGQDIFFRQGEYNPGSRGGQELIAHELTHVVQQGSGAVQRAPRQPQKLPPLPATEAPSATSENGQSANPVDLANVSYRLTEVLCKAQSGSLNPSKSVPTHTESEPTIQLMYDKYSTTELKDLNALNDALFQLTPQITGISLDMLETPGATTAMLNEVIAEKKEVVLYNTMKRGELLRLLQPALADLVNTRRPNFAYDAHGNKHFPNGSPGSKFTAGKEEVNPQLEDLILPLIGRIRRTAKGKDMNFYYTGPGIKECNGKDLTIQLTYKYATDEVEYHGYPDDNVNVYRLSTTKGGSEIED